VDVGEPVGRAGRDAERLVVAARLGGGVVADLRLLSPARAAVQDEAPSRWLLLAGAARTAPVPWGPSPVPVAAASAAPRSVQVDGRRGAAWAQPRREGIGATCGNGARPRSRGGRLGPGTVLTTRHRAGGRRPAGASRTSQSPRGLSLYPGRPLAA